MAPTRTCFGCSGSIVKLASHCTSCKAFYHPGCVKRKSCCWHAAFKEVVLKPPTSSQCTSQPSQPSDEPTGLSTSSSPQLLGDSLCGAASSSQAASVLVPISTPAGPSTLDEVFRLLNARFDDLDARLSGLTLLRDQVDENSRKIDKLEQENQALRGEIMALRQSQFSEQAELRRVAVAVHEAEVIISGAPCPSVESTGAIVKQVAAAVDCPLLDSDIVSSRFLISRARASDDRPLPLIVKLRSNELRTRLLEAKKRKGRLFTGNLTPPPVGPASNIYINEALPSNLYRLLAATKTEAKRLGLKYVWHRDGVILVRKTDGAPISRIRTMDDLAALKSS